jgi:hypothetical protein
MIECTDYYKGCGVRIDSGRLNLVMETGSALLPRPVQGSRGAAVLPTRERNRASEIPGLWPGDDPRPECCAPGGDS